MTELREDRVYARHGRRTGAVLIVGAGAVGGFTAEELSRIGISPLWLLDYDVLEQPNLVRHPLGAEFLEQPKAQALADKIRHDFPLCRAHGIVRNFLALSEAARHDYVRRADVVVAASDTFDCQRAVNRACFATETAAVFPGVWVDDRLRDAEVGEVLWVLPGRHTPCFECAFSSRQAAGDVQAGRGMRADIQLIALVTAHVVMALIDPSDDRAALLDPERTYVTVHGFMPTSQGVRARFDDDGLRNFNVRIPFPPTPCPGCGAHEVQVWRPPRPTPPTGEAPPPRRPGAPGMPYARLVAAAVIILLIAVGVILGQQHSAPAPSDTAVPTAPVSSPAASARHSPTAQTPTSTPPSTAPPQATPPPRVAGYVPPSTDPGQQQVPAGATTLGGVNLQQYCRSLAPGTYAVLRYPNAWGWRCSTSPAPAHGNRKGDLNINVTAACEEQYGRGVRSHYRDYDKPASWFCYRS